jgi:hypothetical protein
MGDPTFGRDKTHGIMENPTESAEGLRMIKEFEKRGLDREAAITATEDLMSSGSSMPLANPIEVGDKFYKIVPEGGSVGTNSPFWGDKRTG